MKNYKYFTYNFYSCDYDIPSLEGVREIRNILYKYNKDKYNKYSTELISMKAEPIAKYYDLKYSLEGKSFIGNEEDITKQITSFLHGRWDMGIVKRVEDNLYRLTLSSEDSTPHFMSYLYFKIENFKMYLSDKVFMMIYGHKFEYTIKELEEDINKDIELLKSIDEFKRDSKVIKKRKCSNYIVIRGKMFNALVEARRVSDRHYYDYMGAGCKQVDTYSNLISKYFPDLDCIFPFFLLDSMLMYGSIKEYDGHKVGTLRLHRYYQECLFIIEFPDDFRMETRNGLIAELGYKTNILIDNISTEFPYLRNGKEHCKDIMFILNSGCFEDRHSDIIKSYLERSRTYKKKFNRKEYNECKDIYYYDEGLRVW